MALCHDNEEFQDSTSSLTNTEIDLNSTQQGYIKAITKLVRSIERANHHIQLLKTAIEKKTPPRGRIPKISSKIPDTPGNFIIKWVGIQQETGLQLTETLKDYWTERAKKLIEELDPIKNKVRLETSPAQWNRPRQTNTTTRDKTPEKVQEDHHPYHQPQQTQTNTRRNIPTIKRTKFYTHTQ